MTNKNVLKFEIRGEAPLLMHSDRYSNPLDPLTKAHKQLTSKRKKTDEDQIAILHSEWMGSLYFDDQKKIYIPGHVIEAALLEAAKIQKLGKQFKRGATVIEDKCLLEYTGPKKIAKLWEDPTFRDIRGVRVQQSKIMRCRPKFNDWGCTFQVAFHPQMLQDHDIQKMVEDCGSFIGLCDYRPKFGRFSIQKAA